MTTVAARTSGLHERTVAVCIATLMRPTGETGVQTHFNGVLRFLASHGLPAMCVTPFSAPRALVYPVFGMRRFVDRVSPAASVWWYRHWHGRFLRLALRRALRRTPHAAVVYAQCPVSADAALRARRETDRVFMVVHFNVSQADEWAEKGMLRSSGTLYRRIKRFEERTLPQLDGIVYVSDFMRRELEARIPALRGVRSSVIPNFVSLPSRTNDHHARPGSLVSVGTLEPRKNQAYVLEILKAAADMGHRYEVTLVGEGPDRGALERQALETGIREQVRFLGFRADAQELLPGHRLYCHAARQENLPLALLEAMAHGIPVAAAPTGGIPELLDDGVEGFYWPLDQPRAAASRLVGFMEDEAALDRMGIAARERVERGFTAEVVGARLAEFLTAPENDQRFPASSRS